MKNVDNMKRIYMLLAAALAVSCSFDGMRLQKPEELGTDKDEYIVSAEGGQVEIKVYANAAGTLVPLEAVSWAEIDNPVFDCDGIICLDVAENTQAKRSLSIEVATDVRKDTICLKQEGAYEEMFELESAGVIVYNGLGGPVRVGFKSNIQSEALQLRTVYLDAGNWISSVKIEDGFLCLSTIDNTDEKNVRKAVLEIRYRDGWGEETVSRLNVTQANARNRIGNQISFEELRNLAGDDPVELNDDYTLEGYVVSDRNSGNAGDNIQSTSTTIDTTVCHKTAYMESLDGRYGVLLEFATADDNILDNNSKAIINLEGVKLHRNGTADTGDNEPLRYSLTGLVSSKVISCDAVDPAEIPLKEKRMSELSDDDIYTRITLKDCEFPVRKGSLTPVNDGYTYLFKANRFTKFPTLIRDIEGESMYLYTNVTCRYRRDGSRMGYGRGSVSGILVHEKFRRFIDRDAADEELCGNIGRYQLRHQCRADIAFEDSFKDSFSEMICEWRYLTQGNDSDHGWNATYGSGTMNHSSGSAVQGTFNTHAYPVYSYSYLGQCGGKIKNNQSGFGVILEDGTDYGRDYDFDAGKGVLSANNTVPMAWMSSIWWNDGIKSPEYWFIRFSTKGISTDCLSLQLSSLNASQEGHSPVKWKLQWAESNDASTVWADIAEYVVPDVVLYTVTQPWQSPGYKAMDFRLPLEMLDRDDVYIRMIPDGRTGNGNTTKAYLAADYKNGSSGNSAKANNAIDYVAVRYNK